MCVTLPHVPKQKKARDDESRASVVVTGRVALSTEPPVIQPTYRLFFHDHAFDVLDGGDAGLYEVDRRLSDCLHAALCCKGPEPFLIDNVLSLQNDLTHFLRHIERLENTDAPAVAADTVHTSHRLEKCWILDL